jgi:hypothetical protein
MNTILKVERKLRSKLSHYPNLYALIAGIGIILFWRGVWHTVDLWHLYLVRDHFDSIDFATTPWWDGPMSMIAGIIILRLTGAFVSSFIGNELILSGLRGERKLTEQAEEGVQNEIRAIADIKDELMIMSKKLEELEAHAHKNHTS